MIPLEYFEMATRLTQAGEPFVVVTLIGARGGAPNDPGCKAIVSAGGLEWGTVGGGKIEARCIAEAQSRLAAGQASPEAITWNLQRDIGMTCGGEVTMLFESAGPLPWTIAVFGAGHVAQALVRTLLPLPCRLHCFDPRTEWVERLPEDGRLHTRLMSQPAEAVAELPSDTYFVVMTQGHATDVPILEKIFQLHPQAPYIGVIGSAQKAIRLKSELKERGVSEGLLERLHCPLGLPLGSSHPPEIAISIAAELLKVRDEKGLFRRRGGEGGRPL